MYVCMYVCMYRMYVCMPCMNVYMYVYRKVRDVYHPYDPHEDESLRYVRTKRLRDETPICPLKMSQNF